LKFDDKFKPRRNLMAV